MVSLILASKAIAQNIPEPIGRFASYLPFQFRLGSEYSRMKVEALRWSAMTEDERISWLLPKLKDIVRYAYNSVDFYRHHYDKFGFEPSDFKSWDDFIKIPIVTKSDLQSVTLSERSVTGERKGMLINTGGTSGQPLEFFVDKNAFAREWAHMHLLWETLGYHRAMLKLTFRGKDYGSKPVHYNAVHNEYSVNAYSPTGDVISAINKLACKKRIRFIHGYPSAIYEFLKNAKKNNEQLLVALRSNLKGVLFGSEYPAPVFRDYIESVLCVPTLSWYGHSEMAVLAGEEQPFVYRPMHTYGYCEAVSGHEGSFRLVGTSLYNKASPFIRYDTGDLIQPLADSSLLEQFRITEGRSGDFIIDKNGKRISLTALVFGRHHSLFSWAKFVQVRQDQPGKVVVIVTVPEGMNESKDRIAKGFDSKNVALDFIFETVKEPYKTPAGKVPLLVNKLVA